MQASLQARNDSAAAQMDAAKTAAQKGVLADNRPEAVAQGKLAEMINNSPGTMQLRAMQEAMQNSPRMVAQRHEMNALSGGAVSPQGDGAMSSETSQAQREEKPNNTGLPDRLKAGIESLSGMSMDHVKVHYNSDKPATLQAHAYAHGSEIHLAPGQEQHLPHEAWHVVQQEQGRVMPTVQLKDGINVNDNVALEREADRMGARALMPPFNHGEGTVSNEPGGGNREAMLQRKSIKMEGEGLTEQMKARFATAYDQFNTAILATSPLSAQDNNQIVIWGVSQAGSGMRDYGSTTIYLGNNAYQGEDYRNFTELWGVSLANHIDPQTAVRIVIAINLTLNRTIEELYATLLHEWFVHAVKWKGALDYIRQDKGQFAVGWIQGQGHVKRAKGEHDEFAKTSDEELASRVVALGLTGTEKDRTLAKMIEDRNLHAQPI